MNWLASRGNRRTRPERLAVGLRGCENSEGPERRTTSQGVSAAGLGFHPGLTKLRKNAHHPCAVDNHRRIPLCERRRLAYSPREPGPGTGSPQAIMPLSWLDGPQPALACMRFFKLSKVKPSIHRL